MVRRSLSGAMALVLTTTASLWACGGPSSEPGGGGASAEDARLMLMRLSTDVFVPAVTDFQVKAQALQEATQAFAAAVDDGAKAQLAQEAWRQAMASWQLLEPLQVGPAAPPLRGGQDLRSLIYSWPTTSRCLIDQQLASETYLGGDAFLSGLGANARGLDALEYLLFNAGDESACPNTVDIIVDGRWVAAVNDGLTPRRAAYATLLADDVARQAQALVQGWESFGPALSTAGADSVAFDMTQDALNAISDALFYLDTETKSMKLGLPSGRVDDAGIQRGSEVVEHPFARVSSLSVVQNIQGVGHVLQGRCEPPSTGPCGLLDLLRGLGAHDLATRMDEALALALAASQALEPDLRGQLEAGSEDPALAYDVLRGLTSLMKTEMLATLDLSPPDSAADDND